MKQIIVFIVFCLTIHINTSKAASCSIADITIKSFQAGFQNVCAARQCMFMKGIAVLNNACATPVGVQVKITGYNKAGEPIQTRELWPASVRNIPPGNYTFSLDSYLEYDPKMKKFNIEPIDIKDWKH